MGTLMAKSEYEDLLAREGELTVADFIAVNPDLPFQTVHSRVRSLVRSGVLSRTGRGRYLAVHRPEYVVPVTEWMLEVNEYLNNQCVGIDHCIVQKGLNLWIEVARSGIQAVLTSLTKKYQKVISVKDFNRFPAPLEGYIVVGALVSEAPIKEVSGCPVPSLEKDLVDSLCRTGSKSIPQCIDFQRAIEVYPVNYDRMRRYASRRGVADELDKCLSSVDDVRVELFRNIQRYFSKVLPVSRAWIFGSFARKEETPESDIDLLVDYAPEAKVSLLDIIRHKLDLERITGRQVDLVENGYLKPFASPSVDRDKYLIYER